MMKRHELYRFVGTVALGAVFATTVAGCATQAEAPVCTDGSTTITTGNILGAGDTYPNDVIIPTGKRELTIFVAATEPDRFPTAPLAILINEEMNVIATINCPAGEVTTFPLPAGARSVRLFNPGGNALTDFTLLFGSACGQ